MARLPRYYLADHPQHIIVRGNNGSQIFGSPDDYEYYLLQLTKACRKHDCELHAYVLMPNHVHLLMTPRQTQGIGKAMQMIGRYYVQYFNQRYQRSGTLWEGRYKATLLDADDYLLACSRYIELNPVRHKLVADPAEYRWSSYGGNALGKTDHTLTPSVQYLRLGDNREARSARYRSLFNQPLNETIVKDIREATNKAWVLGEEAFKDRIRHQVNRRVEPRPRGGDRRSQAFRAQQTQQPS